MQDEEGNPYVGKDFEKIYALDSKKAILTRQQSALTVKRKQAVQELLEKHPYIRKNVKRTLKVKR